MTPRSTPWFKKAVGKSEEVITVIREPIMIATTIRLSENFAYPFNNEKRRPIITA